MELQNFINFYPNYISKFKKSSFKVRSFKDLKIVSHAYDQVPDFKVKGDHWKMFCRGAVINSDNKIVCLPPAKAIELMDKDELPTFEETGATKGQYESLIDGTMINLFFHNDVQTVIE